MADTLFRTVPQGEDQASMLLPLAIMQDGAGYLWAAGEGGLLRWDGYRFRLYADGSDTPDGLSAHDVLTLHCDAGGTLWVGTTVGELARYDPRTDRFQPVRLTDAPGGVGVVSSIDDDGAGGLWVATRAGLFHLDAGAHVTARLHHDSLRPGSLPDDAVQAVLRDHQGNLFVGGRSGLWRGTGGNRIFAAIGLPAPGGAGSEVTHLLQDEAGKIWIGTRHHGAYVLGVGQTAATPVARATGADERAGSESMGVEIMGIADAGGGKIWFATFGHGIVEVDEAGTGIRRIRHDPSVPGSLDSDSVYALFRDRSGLVWTGTTLGLSQHNPGDGGFWTVFGSPGKARGLQISDVTALLLRPDGALWAGSEADGIEIVGPDGAARGKLDVQRVFCLAGAAERDGPVFIGTRSGLYRADAEGRHVARVDIPGRRPTAGVLALSILDGTLWLGGSDDGLWALRIGADGTASVLRHEDAPALTNAMVHRFMPAPFHRLVVGTANGIDLLDTRTGVIERILHDPGDPASLNPGSALSFLLDRQGRLWAGSNNAGISVMLGRDAAGRPRFRHISVADGLPNPDVAALLMDAQGRIWASTDSGLAMIDPRSFAVRAFRAVDGVAIATYWNGSAEVTPQGDLLFGGTNGMTIVRPSAIGDWRFRPPVVINDVALGGRAARAIDKASGTVTVHASANSLSAEFASLDFSAPGRLRYRYRLAGYDAGWIDTDAAHRTAAYTNLPPGRYTLFVQGSNRHGEWSEPPAMLRVVVEPAWFQTLWFRLFEVASAGVLVAGLVQRRTVILRRRQRELERLVAERTAQLSARTVELTDSQDKLRHLAYVDALTGLPNRRAFHEKVQALLATPPPPFGLMLVDLDGFKAVNDTLGHDAGDAVLAIASGRIRDTVRESDFVARLGGDEFAIILHAAREPTSVAWAGDRLIITMAAPMLVKGNNVTIGASAGAALFPRDGRTAEELYKRADLALYAAKRAGRGAWRWYLEEMGSAAAD